MKQELKIAIEDMTRCAGSCQGCVLTANERQSVSRWDARGWSRLSIFLRSWLDYAEKNILDGPLDELAVNLGQGDHFLLSGQESEHLVRWLSETFEGKASAFITASGVTGRNRLEKAVNAFHSASLRHNQALMIDVILDPVSLANKRLSIIYEENLNIIRETFGGMDLNINLSPEVVKSITPRDLDQFLIRNGFSIVTINLVPTIETSIAFSQNWALVINWLDEFVTLYPAQSSRPYVNNYMTTLANHAKRIHDIEPLVESIFANAKRSLYINNDHEAFFIQTGIGDMPMSTRTSGIVGFTTIDNGFDPLLSMKKAKKFAADVSLPFISGSCLGCEFNRVCTLAGSYAFMKTIGCNKKDEDCPLGIKQLIRHSMARHQDYEISPMAQKGVDKALMRMNPVDCPIIENKIMLSILSGNQSK